jgi:hypothetical protein
VLFTTADEMAQVQQAAQRTNLLDDRNKELLLLVRRLICTHNPFYQICVRVVAVEVEGAQGHLEGPGGGVFTRNVVYREVLNG